MNKVLCDQTLFNSTMEKNEGIAVQLLREILIGIAETGVGCRHSFVLMVLNQSQILSHICLM